MDHSDASTASFGNAALAADRVSASMNTSPETIEEDPPEVRRPATTTRTRSRSPSEPSTPPRRSPRSDNSPRETRRRTSLGPERIPALEDGTMVPVPSDSETVGRVVGSNNLQVSQSVDTLSDQCASLLAEVQVLQQKETWATECEHRQAEVIRHESQIHEVMTAHLQELYSDDKITRSSLNQVTQSRDMLLSAAQDLQTQLDPERTLANQRIIELGEAAAKSSTEAIDQVLRLGHQEVYSVISERDNLKSELMMTINKYMINEDEFKQEVHQLKMRASTLHHEGIEEMKHARSTDEHSRRKIQNLSEEREDLKSRLSAQDSFINTLRKQLREANDEIGRKQVSSLVVRSTSSSSADHRMAEMKMNILEENIQRKDQLTNELHRELLEAKNLEAQLRAAVTQVSQASGSQPSTMNEDMAKLRTELRRAQDALKSEEKEAYEYHEGMLQNQQDMMRYEADAQRLRDDRNKYRDKYDEERRNAATTSATNTGNPTGATSSSSSSKVSRKEHEKIVIPSWPKIHDLEVWKAQVVAAVVTASGDERQDDWINWLSDAFQSPMDLDILESSGDSRFASIDAKLGITLHTIIHAAGERSHDVQLKVRQMMQKRARGTTPGMVKGREMLALIVDSFRSADNVDVMYASKHLFDLRFPGDNQLSKFLGQWDEILSGMGTDDMLPDKALRNLLWDKIKDSKVMALDLQVYDNLLDKDPDKSYQKLREIIAKWIRKSIETTNKKEREKAFGNIVKATPAQEKKDTKSKDKAVKSNPKSNAAPVLPQAAPKDHNKKKERGRSATKSPRGEGRGRSSTPADTSKIGCAYHFYGKNGCSRGDKCKFSHSDKHKGSAKKPDELRGRSRSKSPGPRGGSPKPIHKQACWNYQKGVCKFGDKCKRQHQAAPAAKQEAKGKAKPKPAAPAYTYKSRRGDICGQFCSDDEDESAVRVSRDIKSDLAVTFDDEVDVTTFTCVSGNYLNRYPYASEKKDKEVDMVDSEMITSEHALKVSEVARRVARARGKMMKNFSDDHEAKCWIQVDQKLGIEVTVNLADFTYKEVIRDVGKQIAPRGYIMILAAAEQYEGPPTRFIMDTGCGHDLISREKAKAMNLTVKEGPDSINFMTANGVTTTSDVAEINVGELPIQTEAHVLENTPSVFSVGKRCMEQGYSFVWPAGELPFLIDHNANKIPLSVHDNIPYVKVNDDNGRCLPRRDELASILHRIFGGERALVQSLDDPTREKSTRRKRNRRKKKIDLESVCDLTGEEDIHIVMAGEGDEDDERGPVEAPDDYSYEEELPEGEADPRGELPDEEDEGVTDSEHDGESDDDDEGGLEVDVVDGVPRLAKPGVLKNEAKSLLHLLTHRYKNPYCKACVRSKMKHFKTNRGAFKRKLKKFGDLVTFDFMNTQKMIRQGMMTDKDILVIRDRYTGIIWGYPLKTSDSDGVVQSMKSFMGKRKVVNAYSDEAPQFESAMRELRIPLDQSLPGHPQNNSLAERNNQFLLATTTTCLLHAGLPPCFWPFAVECVSHILNVEKDAEGQSAWLKLHKEDFPGELIPLGTKVYFKPSTAREIEQDHKFDPDAIPGIFAGYMIGTGMNWSRKYKVWAMSDFATQNLAYDAERPVKKLMAPHITEKLFIEDAIEFPLKSEYEKINSTLEGMKLMKERGGSPDAIGNPQLPEPDDDDDQDDTLDQPPDDDDDKPDGEAVPKPIEDARKDLTTDLPDHHSVGKPSDGIIYLNDDGERVKIAKDGRLYKVGSDGRRAFANSPRPKSFMTPEEWQKLSVKDRAIAKKAGDDVDKVVERMSKKLKDRGLGSSTDKKGEAEKDELLEDLEELRGDDGSDEEKKAKKKSKKDKKKEKKEKRRNRDDKSKDRSHKAPATPSTKCDWDSDDDFFGMSPKSISSESTCFPSDEEFLTEWDESAMWEENDGGYIAGAAWRTENMYNPTTGQVCTCIGATMDVYDPMVEPFPSMPCVVRDEHHRPKIGNYRFYNALVSRPVSRSEMLSDPEAMQSMMNEWGGLWGQDTFDGSWIREHDEVVATSKAEKHESAGRLSRLTSEIWFSYWS